MTAIQGLSHKFRHTLPYRIMSALMCAINRYRIDPSEYKKMHDNPLFYTLSPMLLTAIDRAFYIQSTSPWYHKNFPERHGYYEFGLFKGFSFWFAEQISRKYTKRDFMLYGFDSFEGLPESKVDIDPVFWKKGNYAASYKFVISQLKDHDCDFSRIRLFKGWYSKRFFEKIKTRHKFHPASIVVIDSDIYESCVEVLDFLKNLWRPGTLLLFDDYNCFSKSNRHGERRAFAEFEKKNPNFHKELVFEFGRDGAAFRVLQI